MKGTYMLNIAYGWFVLFLFSFQGPGQRSLQTNKEFERNLSKENITPFPDTSISDTDLKWPGLKKEYLPGTYWWWMGSAVDKKNLSFNLESLRKTGIGNVHIIPIYGVTGQEKNYIDFLSPVWMEMLSYTLNQADRLDMNVDMSTTTGWPFGGSHVTQQNAAKKIEYKTYKLTGGEQFREQIEGKDLQCVIAYSNKGEIINLTKKAIENTLNGWPIPPGNWQIYALWQKGTGQKVKRAAPGNEGLVLNPFSATSMDTYLKRYDRAFSTNKGTLLRAQYHDSYEYYQANWTNELFNEFKSRRGYDLKEHLPALFNQGTADNISRIKADYRTTISELHLEYIQTWTRWAKSHGWITRNEAHGAPANLLDVYAAADIPETETFGATRFDIPGLSYNPENISGSAPPNPLILRFASSAAHVSGKRLVSSETCTWLRDHFKASLAQVKPEIDQLFLSGINHVFYHGNAYSPKNADWPGWLFYASTHFEQRNAFWRDFSALNNYVGRCQSILQSGKPANDILLYWPLADIWHKYSNPLIKTLNVHSTGWLTDSPFGSLAGWLKDNGYAFDYLSDQQLQKVTFNNHKLTTEGTEYKTIVVPKTEHIPLKTWKKLMTLARAGATIIIHQNLPKDVPGWFDLKKRQRALQNALAELKFEVSIDSILLAKKGKGQVILSSDPDALLKFAKVFPEPIVRQGVGYIRRIHNEGFYYFLSNLSDRSLDRWVPLATPLQSAVILDPLFPNKSGIAATRQKEGNFEIYLQLKPGESMIIRTFSKKQATGKPWVYLQKDKNPIKISGQWYVKFIEGGPVLPAAYTTDHPDFWTNLSDQEANRFAGTAQYSVKFTLPDTAFADFWLLDLGKVRESARVRINGNKMGSLWSIPFCIQFNKYLKKGTNILEIEVTNLSANRLRDLDLRGVKWQKYFFVNVFYKKFDSSVWPLMDSGLRGPVLLYPLKVLNPANYK